MFSVLVYYTTIPSREPVKAWRLSLSAPTILRISLYLANVLKRKETGMSTREQIIEIISTHPELIDYAIEILEERLPHPQPQE